VPPNGSSTLPKNRRKARPAKRARRAGRRKQSGNMGSNMRGGRIVSQGVGRPDEMRVRLRYTDDVILTLSGSAGTLQTWAYSLNNPRVCNINGSTGQPALWTQFAAEYGQFVCLGSRIRWRISQIPAGIAYGALGTKGAVPTNTGLISAVMLPVSSATGALSSIRGASVQEYSKRRFDFVPESKSLVNVDINPRVVWKGSHAMTTAKIQGEPNVRQSSYEAAVTASPATAAWVFAFQDVTSDTAYQAVFHGEFDIEYDTIFFNKVALQNAQAPQPPLRDAFTRGDIPDLRRGYEEKKEAPLQKSFPLSAMLCGPESAAVSATRVMPVAPAGYVLVKSLPPRLE